MINDPIPLELTEDEIKNLEEIILLYKKVKN